MPRGFEVLLHLFRRQERIDELQTLPRPVAQLGDVVRLGHTEHAAREVIRERETDLIDDTQLDRRALCRRAPHRRSACARSRNRCTPRLLNVGMMTRRGPRVPGPSAAKGLPGKCWRALPSRVPRVMFVKPASTSSKRSRNTRRSSDRCRSALGPATSPAARTDRSGTRPSGGRTSEERGVRNHRCQATGAAACDERRSCVARRPGSQVFGRVFSNPRPRSSADRASASGAVCAGSSPAGGAPPRPADRRLSDSLSG